MVSYVANAKLFVCLQSPLTVNVRSVHSAIVHFHLESTDISMVSHVVNAELAVRLQTALAVNVHRAHSAIVPVFFILRRMAV